MARSLSDDPVKLRNELLGLSRRQHAIEKKLVELQRTEDAEEVLIGDELHEAVEGVKALVGAPVEELPDDVAPDEWGAF